MPLMFTASMSASLEHWTQDCTVISMQALTLLEYQPLNNILVSGSRTCTYLTLQDKRQQGVSIFEGVPLLMILCSHLTQKG